MIYSSRTSLGRKRIRNAILIAIFFSVQILVFDTPAEAQNIPNDSIVKVYTVRRDFDYTAPWNKGAQEHISGSGCIIRDKEILTNAHVVADAVIIQVCRAGTAEKFIAKVKFVAHDCDLAIIKVDEERFFQGAAPLEIGELPKLREEVTVYGFPKGGEELCITKGIVSRVEHRRYAHSGAKLLCCQIDAPINSGNSGGPVISNGRVVGVAFQSLEGENINYMVPVPLIDRFLHDIRHIGYDGVPSLEIAWQPIENPAMRAMHGLDLDSDGVLVKRVFSGSPAEGIIQPGDVILAVEGTKVAYDGTIEFRKGERTIFEHLVHAKFMGDKVCVDILRDSKLIRCEIKLTVPMNSCQLVPFAQYEKAPTYFIIGGLVFQPLTSNYLTAAWGKEEYYPTNLEYYYRFASPEPDRREVVVLTHVIADSRNVGYHNLEDLVIVSVNGKKISDIWDLIKAVKENQKKYHVFIDDQGTEIVLDRNKLQKEGS